MGAPLILTKNPTVVEEAPTPVEPAEHEEDNAVNGRLDLGIKDNSIYEKSERNSSPYPHDIKHNYHWLIESRTTIRSSHMT